MSLQEEGGVAADKGTRLLSSSHRQKQGINEDDFDDDDFVDMPQKTVHNDPCVRFLIKNKELHGSTMFMKQYNRERKGFGGMRGDGASGRNRRSIIMKTAQVDKSLHNLFMTHMRFSFLEDAKGLVAGTIPQSLVISFAVGVCCGCAAYCYYVVMESLLEFLWETIPETFIITSSQWTEEWYWVWIPIVVFVNAILLGLCVKYIGEPGDLAFTISLVHHEAFIPMDHVLPMASASLCSILSGGSLGPEAPLVAICGALAGWISRRVFRQKIRNVVRKHTLMGMAAALAAFFGVPLGGSLFALEINSRFGIEYFEHALEAIFCGEVCMVVFRTLTGGPIGPIWDLGVPTIEETYPGEVIVGAIIGLLGVVAAYIFALFHWKVMACLQFFNLTDNKYAVYRALLGAICITIIAILIPHTMFWGEMEFETIAKMSPNSKLPHVWPTTSLIGFDLSTEPSSWVLPLIVGFAKLLSISFTVAGGYRGGFIFPMFAAGGAFGRALYNGLVLLLANTQYVPPQLQICTLCFSAGLNVSITRTALATPLILSFLAGEPRAIPALLAASLCSLFGSSFFVFIKTQIARSDLDHSLFHKKDGQKVTNEMGEPDYIDEEPLEH